MAITSLSPAAVDTILVPRGAEWRAVCRGLKRRREGKPRVRAVPMGCQALAAHLETWQQSPDFLERPPRAILFLGLGGSLSLQYCIGELVIYEGCACASGPARGEYRPCAPILTGELADLPGRVSLGRGLTCDRFLSSPQEKARLARQYRAGVVDMESFVLLESFSQRGIPVAVARAISDGPQQQLPDLTPAISEEGELKPWPLAREMGRQPLAALQLIYSSWRGLRSLTRFVGAVW